MFFGEQDIVKIKAFGFLSSNVYKGTKLIWQAIRSCFGAGYWRGDKPWFGTDAWKG